MSARGSGADILAVSPQQPLTARCGTQQQTAGFDPVQGVGTCMAGPKTMRLDGEARGLPLEEIVRNEQTVRQRHKTSYCPGIRVRYSGSEGGRPTWVTPNRR